jgi:hypothetical protein
MLFVAYREAEAWLVRRTIREVLNAPDNEFFVMVNGQPAANGTPVVEAIRGVHLSLANHTHPDHETSIAIRRKQNLLELTLARDSGLPREYWVFWTREKGNPNRLEIGRIKTSIFDDQ